MAAGKRRRAFPAKQITHRLVAMESPLEVVMKDGILSFDGRVLEFYFGFEEQHRAALEQLVQAVWEAHS